jgi:NitT/TauT family transport system ATP-binding protein/sulfonate transport system ATP-binding protein
MDRTVVHIECDGVGKSYLQKGRTVPVLEGLSFGVRERELLVVLGPGQSGKTTLLRLMAGLEAPDSGCVRMHGEPVTGPGTDRGLVFQSYMLFPWLTVLGNVEIGLNIQGRRTGATRAQARDKARAYLDMVGLAGFEDYFPHQLSGGMKQRVGIARAYALEPQVMLLDEPFGQLDAQTRLSMEQETERIWRANRKTMVFVTNNIDEAVYLADRIAILEGKLPGRLAAIRDVPLPRPRDPMDVAFLRLREEITAMQKLAL